MENSLLFFKNTKVEARNIAENNKKNIAEISANPAANIPAISATATKPKGALFI